MTQPHLHFPRRPSSAGKAGRHCLRTDSDLFYYWVCLSPVCLQLPELEGFLFREHSLSSYIPWHRVYLVDCMDLICSLCSWWKRFNLFLRHSAPGAQLWFYPHIYLGAIHKSLLLRLPWRTRVRPVMTRSWRWHGCLDRGDSQAPGAMGSRDTTLIVFF